MWTDFVHASNPYQCTVEVSKESSKNCDLYRVHKHVYAADAVENTADRSINLSNPLHFAGDTILLVYLLNEAYQIYMI